jgi:PAS domain S-box-containing protein
MNNIRKSPILAAISAFLVSLSFLIAFVLLDFVFGKVDYTIRGVILSHLNTPSFWLLYLFPLFTGLAAWKLSVKTRDHLNSLAQERDKEQERTKQVYNYVQGLLGKKIGKETHLDFNNDPLAKSLVILRENIAKNKEEEDGRRKEDEQRRWVSEGLAMFGEILRNNHDDLNELSYQIVSNLVKYTASNQGALFILNDDVKYNRFFEMTACYAYDRRKFADEKIDFGEGMIGTCALEKKTIFLTEIPDSYLRITSGLGKSNPRSLLLVPLNINEENYGVIELASFNTYTPYEIEFIEKIAESVASTISGVKINIKTAKLLKESQEQAEIMASQEEEMRQNMEELQATQEEAARQSDRFVSFSNSVNQTLLKSEYQPDGTLISANDNFLKKLGYHSNSEIEGKNIRMFIHPLDKEWFDAEWIKIVRAGETFEGEIRHLTKAGKDLFMMATFSQVSGKNNELESILFLAIDSNDLRKQITDFEGQIATLDRVHTRAIFGVDGSLIEINNKLCDILELQREELQNKSVSDLISPDEKESFQSSWENISSGNPFSGQIKILTKKGAEKWLYVHFGALLDMNGEISRIVMTGNDLTKERELETLLSGQSDLIEEKEKMLRQLKDDLKLLKKQAGL